MSEYIRQHINPSKCITHSTQEDYVEKLVEHIENGYNIDPIFAIKYNGLFFVIDGSHRVKACRRLGILVEAEIIDYDKLTAELNSIREENKKAIDNLIKRRFSNE